MFGPGCPCYINRQDTVKIPFTQKYTLSTIAQHTKESIQRRFSTSSTKKQQVIKDKTRHHHKLKRSHSTTAIDGSHHIETIPLTPSKTVSAATSPSSKSLSATVKDDFEHLNEKLENFATEGVQKTEKVEHKLEKNTKQGVEHIKGKN